MKIKTLTLALLTSLVAIHANSHLNTHQKNTHPNIQYQSSSVSQEIASAMHGPMMSAPWVESKNIEYDFLVNMIPHHEGAILSSQILLEHTKNIELILIAQEIISTQKKEIKQFKEVIKTLNRASSKNYTHFAKDAKADMEKMMSKMMNISHTGDFDKDYMKGMIIHHQGAIDISNQVLRYTKNQEIIKIAKEIIKVQEEEIAKFKFLLNQN